MTAGGSTGDSQWPAWRAWRTYRDGASLTTRAFLAARAAVLPASALVGAFSDVRGSVLSIGAGHGLAERAIALTNPHLSFSGFELDASRVTTGNATCDASIAVHLICADVRSLPDTELFDAALACDLFHHLAPEDQPAMAAELARRIRPGGRLVVKDIARTPGWKHAWNRFHDRVVAGDSASCIDPAEMAALLRRRGFLIHSTSRLHPASPYPHYLVVAERSA